MRAGLNGRLLIALGASLAIGSVAAQTVASGATRTVFVQAGATDDAVAATVGATLPLPWQASGRLGLVVTDVELALGRWSGRRDGDGHRVSWQAGAMPRVRWFIDARGRAAFVEVGIGVNVIVPRWKTTDRRFSTAFNFGDQLGVGWRFGAQGAQALVLRIEHFSNGSIREPNPGENFVQLRYERAL